MKKGFGVRLFLGLLNVLLSLYREPTSGWCLRCLMFLTSLSTKGLFCTFEHLSDFPTSSFLPQVQCLDLRVLQKEIQQKTLLGFWAFLSFPSTVVAFFGVQVESLPFQKGSNHQARTLREGS